MLASGCIEKWVRRGIILCEHFSIQLHNAQPLQQSLEVSLNRMVHVRIYLEMRSYGIESVVSIPF
ncbi:MAG: hypothetical protein MUC81_09250 [Bacteroidia bacterium]|nr:hypothetical protein [Bacteroidia bacterium]